jgi:recombination protein RecR
MAVPLLPAPVRELLDDLERLPGIGPKSAQRMVFSLLHRPKEELEKFAKDLLSLGATRACGRCGMLSEQDTCTICRDRNREQETICVVETPVDVLAIERTGEYRGLYHVLGGVVSPLEHIGPDHLNLASLIRRVGGESASSEKRGLPVQEVILALNPSTEGEITALYLQDVLKNFPGKITRIAQGLPTGAALEFADDLTIARALAGRREVSTSRVAATSLRQRRRIE